MLEEVEGRDYYKYSKFALRLGPLNALSPALSRKIALLSDSNLPTSGVILSDQDPPARACYLWHSKKEEVGWSDHRASRCLRLRAVASHAEETANKKQDLHTGDCEESS